jgi:hypothetical protein
MRWLWAAVILAGCAPASTRPPAEAAYLPEAWLIVAVHDDGLMVHRANFPSRESAEGFLLSRGPEPGENPPTLTVQKDRPDLRVRIDGGLLWSAHHLTMRENWLKRNRRWLEPVRPRLARATLFTWLEGDSDDPFRARFGGRAPVPGGSSWPVCRRCFRPNSFIGTLDFRRTPVREHVPGDALTFHYCFACAAETEEVGLTWLSAGSKIEFKEPPLQTRNRKGWVGTAWFVNDYPWEDSLLEGPHVDLVSAGQTPSSWVTVSGVKVGGHPHWIHRIQTPTCGCGQAMRFIGQFPGYGEVQFGEGGVAFVFHCADRGCRDTRVVIQGY